VAKEKELEEKEEIRTPFKEFLMKFKKQKTAIAALAFLMLLVVFSIIGEMIVPYGVDEYDYSSVLQSPSQNHLFGTDEFGRDIFSRVILGARISLAVGLSSVTVGAVVGTILGLISGYYGGFIDSVIMRICDTLFAFPGTILAIGIMAILGPGIFNVVIAVAIFSAPSFARIVRSSTLSQKESVYVQAAKSLGASDGRILFKHILPGAMSEIIVYYTMNIGSSILTASSLSFLGMGAQAPSPEWGLQLSTGRAYVGLNWHMTFFPGLAIFLTVLSFNLLGDGLRDALDPKLTQ
jgi:glutathione transport system permease protein